MVISRGSKITVLKYEVSSGTASGFTFPVNTWNSVAFNTVKLDTIGVSIGGNAVLLPVGQYIARFFSYGVYNTLIGGVVSRVRAYNVTASSTADTDTQSVDEPNGLIVSSTAAVYTYAYGGQSRFTLSSAASMSFQWRYDAGSITTIAPASNAGVNEVYSNVIIERV
jgi:hypothetical protein